MVITKDTVKTIWGKVCTKCGSGNYQIKYHSHAGPFEKMGCAGEGCNLEDYTNDDTEHLHYYCQCGYDWVGPTVGQKNNEV